MKNSMRQTLQLFTLFITVVLWVTLHSGCTAGTPTLSIESPDSHNIVPGHAVTEPVVANYSNTSIPDAATILSRTEVPILCYHQLRDWRPSDSKTARDYIVPVEVFQAQMRSLADSGYNTILPDQLYDYLTTGKPLPARPVMITFDDTRVDQYTVALPVLKKYGFKGAFFIMTVSLGRPGYMSKEQVKQLSREGHSIGSHTWDHKNVKKYTNEDWSTQIGKPSKQLEEITGKPVDCFAYPFGLWNKQAITGLKKFGFKIVFQLADRCDDKDPLYSIRRIIVPGQWSGATMQRCMKNSFNNIRKSPATMAQNSEIQKAEKAADTRIAFQETVFTK